MPRTTCFGLGALAVLLLLLGNRPAAAQNQIQTARSFLPAPLALGMGDAAVAFPTEETVFFYNPAHAAHVSALRPHITVVGAQAMLSSNVFAQYDFYRDEIEPLIAENERLTALEAANLYDRTLDATRRNTIANANVLLPSVLVNVGGIGVGGGLFAFSKGRYRSLRTDQQATFEGEPLNASVDGRPLVLPRLEFVGLFDAIAVGTAAINLSPYGVRGLTLGLNAKYTRRYLTFKDKMLDADRLTNPEYFSDAELNDPAYFSEDEQVYFARGDAFSIDLGFLYEVRVPMLPGTVRLGAAFYDTPASDFDYTYVEDFFLNPDPEDVDAEVRNRDIERANDRYNLSPSYRFGVAYTTPSLFGFLKDSGIALDYLGYSDPYVDQSALANFHLGIQGHVAKVLALRAGLSQGLPSVGAGLHLGFFNLEYALYGTQNGSSIGDLPRYYHLLQVAIEIF